MPKAEPAPGPIEPAILYPLADLQGRSGFGADAMRTARSKGLKVLYIANRAFVLGSDFINFVITNATTSK